MSEQTIRTLYLDTETGGFSPSGCGVVEIAIIDGEGEVLLNTLIDPGMPIPTEAMAVHGITDEMVRGWPTLADVLPCVHALARGNDLVIYNKAFDLRFLPGTEEVCRPVCAMQMAQVAMGLSRWPKLSAAAEWAGYTWGAKAHRALEDARAARHVYRKICGAEQ